MSHNTFIPYDLFVFSACRILNVFDNFSKVRRGRMYCHQGMNRYWPSPDSIYVNYPVTAASENVCSGGCDSRYCLANFCIETYFHDCHFPLLRPLVYSTKRSQFQVSASQG